MSLLKSQLKRVDNESALRTSSSSSSVCMWSPLSSVDRGDEGCREQEDRHSWGRCTWLCDSFLSGNVFLSECVLEEDSHLQ